MSDKTPYTINRKLQNIIETSVGEKKNLINTVIFVN